MNKIINRSKNKRDSSRVKLSSDNKNMADKGITAPHPTPPPSTLISIQSTNNTEEQSLHHNAMIAKFLDPNKPQSYKYGRKKLTCMTLCMIALRNNIFLPSFNNANAVSVKKDR